MSDDFKPTVWMLPACIDAYAYNEPLGQFRLLKNPPIGAQLVVTLEDHERAVAAAVAKERERFRGLLEAIEHALRMGFAAAEVLDENSPIRDGIRSELALIDGECVSDCSRLTQREHIASDRCWRNPVRESTDPDTGVSVYLHRDPH